RFAKVDVGAAASGECRAQLRVDETVAEREDGAERPCVEDVRPVHRRHHERNGENRPDADHPDDVRGGGLQQAHAAVERHHRGERSAIRRSAVAVSGTRGFAASASRARSIDSISVAWTVRRSYSFTLVSSGRIRSGTGPTWTGCAPFALTTHGTSITSSSRRSAMLPRFRTLSGTIAFVLP